MTADWADEKAREWLHAKSCAEGHIYNASPADGSEHAYFDELLGGGCAASLAALLREVRTEVLAEADVKFWGEAKSRLLAEVCRVIAEEGSKFAPDVLQRILSRLEKLK